MSALTFLKPLSTRHPARKTHRLIETAAGTRLETQGYGKAANFKFETAQVEDIEDLFRALEARSRRNAFAILGQVRPDIARGEPVNRRYKGDDASIIDVPSRIVPADLDQEPLPDWLDADDIKAVGDYLRGRMPPELQGVSCVVQLSAGFGLSRWTGKPPMLKARLWFVNGTPLDSAQRRAWFRARNASGTSAVMDESMAGCNQPVYTAAPVFEGMADPVPERLRLLLGERDTAEIAPPQPKERTGGCSATAGERRPEVLQACARIIEGAREGEKHNALNRAAYLAGGYVAGGACTEEEARAALREAISKKDGVADLEAAYATIENAMDAGRREPLGVSPENPNPLALSEKSDLDADLARLKKAPALQARATAKAILNRYVWRCPWRMPFADLADAVCQSLPDPAPYRLEDWVRARVGWLERQASEKAREQTDLDAVALRREGVTVDFVASVDDALALIERDPTPLALVKADLGAGKTERILKPLAISAAHAVAITHRVALVEDLCTRLRLTDYKTASKDDLESCNALGLCLNSIMNPKFGDVLWRSQSVLVDEVSAVVRECHNPAGTLAKNAKPTWERLIDLLKKATVACGVDADLSTRDVLELAKATGRPARVVVVRPEPKPLAVNVGDFREIWQAILDCAQAGEPFRVATDSASQARKLEAAIAERFPHLRVMAIHAAPGVATSGREDVKDALSDINRVAGSLDALIHSPVVESGVSLTVPRFVRTFGIFCGAVSPAAFVQMLRRDRTATRFDVGVLGNGVRFEEDRAAHILAAMDASHKRTEEIARCEGGFKLAIKPAGAWDWSVADYRARTNRATNAYAQNLWLLLGARGYAVARFDGAAVPPETLAGAAEIIKERYRDAITSAPDLSAKDRDALGKLYQPGPEQSAAMARHDLKETLAVEKVDRRALDIWDEGKTRAKIARFEAMLEPPLFGLASDALDAAAALPLAARGNRLAKADAYRLAFEALGFDPESGDGEITEQGAREAFENLKASTARAALEHAGICRFSRVPKYPIRWASDLLDKFGLTLKTGRRARSPEGRTRVYALDHDITCNRAGRVLPGWGEMRSILDRRGARFKAGGPHGPLNTYRSEVDQRA